MHRSAHPCAIALAAVLALPVAALAQVVLPAPSAGAPPPARIETVVETLHGTTVRDDYRWLEALESASDEVRAWTTAQNDLTRAVLDNLPGRAVLEARLDALTTPAGVSTPTVRGAWGFFTQREGSQSQPVLVARRWPDGSPRVLVDPNTLDARGLTSLDWYVPSEDGRLLALGLSRAGDEMTVLHVLDVETGEWLADEIPGKVEFGGWMPDARGFLYGQLETPSDAYSRVFRIHRLGRHWRHDPILFRQEQPSRIPGAVLSRDGRWIILSYFEGWSKQDVHVVDVAEWERTVSSKPDAAPVQPVPIAVGLDARFEPQDVTGSTLLMLSTLDAPNGALWAVDLERPARANWRLVIPARPDMVLEHVARAKGCLVASWRKDVSSRLERFALDGEPLGAIELPGLGSAGRCDARGQVGEGIAAAHDRTDAYVAFASWNQPTTIYSIDLESGERETWAQLEVDVDPSAVVVEQEWCASRDGTRVPMFIVHRKDVAKNGRTPTMINGYGGFNQVMAPRFAASDYPWLEAGGVYVVANLRGGGEYGEAWHRAGMLERKQNVFDDLYAVAEHLIAEGYTSSEHLAVMGGSNGGLLTGVAAVQRPDLFAAVISAVPLLDMVRYQRYLMARFWIPEYGDPDDPAQFAWLHAYSPYHNVEDGKRYPAILFQAGENDNRVHPMHARKMAALMQARASNDFAEDPILLWVDRDAGHGAGKPQALRVRDAADRWAFAMWQTGLEYPPKAE